MLSEVLSPLLGHHQRFLLDKLRAGRALGLGSELEVADDMVCELWLSLKAMSFILPPLSGQSSELRSRPWCELEIGLGSTQSRTERK